MGIWPFGRRKKAVTAASGAQERPQPGTAGEAGQRTYLNDSAYLLPKDAQEDARLCFQHYALYQAFGTHYLAPISPDTRTILDVGAGTGIWAMDMAQKFPQAHILGVDLTLTSLPHTLPNTCLFVEADILQGLPFPACQFDYTHQRLLVGAIPAPRWPEVVRELVRVTRPQSWIELLEVGTTVHHGGAATERLLAWVRETSQMRGIDMAMVTQLGEMLKHAGCQAIEVQDIPVPLGAWAGAGGKMLKLDAIRVFQAMRPRTTTSVEHLDKMLTEAGEEWERNHAFYIFHSAYGRRARL